MAESSRRRRLWELTWTPVELGGVGLGLAVGLGLEAWEASHLVHDHDEPPLDPLAALRPQAAQTRPTPGSLSGRN
jgi:hypothetical protein